MPTNERFIAIITLPNGRTSSSHVPDVTSFDEAAQKRLDMLGHIDINRELHGCKMTILSQHEYPGWETLYTDTEDYIIDAKGLYGTWTAKRS